MNKVLLFGSDGGLAHFGHASVALHATGEEIIDLGVAHTEKSDAKRKVLAADDEVRRARELCVLLDAAIPAGCRAICAESMSHPRNASAAGKLKMSWGVLVYAAHARNLAILQASPQEIKKALTGRKDASKEDIARAIADRYGDKPARILDAKKIPNGKREHAYDALASIVACLNSDLVRMLRAGLDLPAIDAARRLGATAGGGVLPSNIGA